MRGSRSRRTIMTVILLLLQNYGNPSLLHLDGYVKSSSAGEGIIIHPRLSVGDRDARLRIWRQPGESKWPRDPVTMHSSSIQNGRRKDAQSCSARGLHVNTVVTGRGRCMGIILLIG